MANCVDAGKGKELEQLMKSIYCIGFDYNRTYPLLELEKVALGKESVASYSSLCFLSFQPFGWSSDIVITHYPLNLSLVFLCLDFV